MTTTEARARELLRAEGLEPPGRWSNGPGDRYADHEHDYDKILVAVRGSITFVLPARSERWQLLEGDRLDLPAGAVHGALVGPDGVACLEAHAPPGSLASSPRRTPGWARTAGSETASRQGA